MEKILIIEDDAVITSILKGRLEEKYEIVTAEDGEQGLALTREHKPNLVILDLLMPNVNGFTYLEKMKNEPGVKDIPVIVQSALSSYHDVQRAMSLGAANFFVKGNVSLEEMCDLVENHIK